jgi:hypothetical protein
MSLIKAVRNTLTKQLAPANITTQNSSLGLSTSAGAMRALQQSGRHDLQTVVQMTNAIGKAGNLPQGVTNSLASKAGLVSQRYHQLEALEEPLVAAMTDAVRSAQLRSRLAKKAADSGQKIAVLDAKTQAAIGWGHQAAHAETNYYQSAYGGGNFAV